jgi:hypothetical protein
MRLGTPVGFLGHGKSAVVEVDISPGQVQHLTETESGLGAKQKDAISSRGSGPKDAIYVVLGQDGENPLAGRFEQPNTKRECRNPPECDGIVQDGTQRYQIIVDGLRLHTPKA